MIIPNAVWWEVAELTVTGPPGLYEVAGTVGPVNAARLACKWPDGAKAVMNAIECAEPMTLIPRAQTTPGTRVVLEAYQTSGGNLKLDETSLVSTRAL